MLSFCTPNVDVVSMLRAMGDSCDDSEYSFDCSKTKQNSKPFK